jgi:hypothetical protein
MGRHLQADQRIHARALGYRDQLLSGIPVVEHRMQLAGTSTSVLIGGAGRQSSSCTAPVNSPRSGCGCCRPC